MTTTTTPYYNAETPVAVEENIREEWTRGEKQNNRYRDVFWTILFYVHLSIIATATIKYAPIMTEEYGDKFQGNNGGRRLFSRLLEDSEVGTGSIIVLLLVVSGLAGSLISSMAMAFMMRSPQGLIKVSLFFNVIVTLAVAILAALVAAIPLAFGSALICFTSLYYAYVVWNRIPFAASNLVTATTAIRSNMGLAFFAYTNLMVSFLWTLWWSFSFLGTNYVVGGCDIDFNCEGKVNGFIIFLFLVSYFWTVQVIQNVMCVTVAGTVGTWWLSPVEASGCCSKGVRDSYLRSITTSFGSICLGSLIVALISAIKEIVHAMIDQQNRTPRRNNSLVMCIMECLLGSIESLVEYFNSWAFVFVGLYGYAFTEASRNAMALFRSRGWTAIIADVLVDTVLGMVSFAVGVITGVLVVLVGAMANINQTGLGGAFVGGMLIGFIMCSTLFSLIGSAVKVVIVCYAEAPSEFQENHPKLSEQMRHSWRIAYPFEFHY